MNFNEFNDWLESVKNLNEAFDEVDSQRDVCYKWIADKIKEEFRKSKNPVPHIHITPDGSEITCSWTDCELNMPVDLIVSLHMRFDFTRKLDIDGTWEKKLIFYPFEES